MKTANTKQQFLPCIVCDRSILDAAFPDPDPNDELAVAMDARRGWVHQPYGATTFYTQGHYGSTFWDSFDGEQCVIAVCDDCLRKKPQAIAYIKKVREHPTRWERFERSRASE
jgi:hypothetical protein